MPHLPKYGNEYVGDPRSITRSLVSLGFYKEPWEDPQAGQLALHDLHIAGLIVLALLTLAPASIAQEKRNPQVIELEGIDVIGKVAKPQVFYVLGRSTVRYEQLKFDQSFVQRIVDTTSPAICCHVTPVDLT